MPDVYELLVVELPRDENGITRELQLRMHFRDTGPLARVHWPPDVTVASLFYDPRAESLEQATARLLGGLPNRGNSA